MWTPCSLQGSYTRGPLRVSSNSKDSTILWFYESMPQNNPQGDDYNTSCVVAVSWMMNTSVCIDDTVLKTADLCLPACSLWLLVQQIKLGSSDLEGIWFYMFSAYCENLGYSAYMYRKKKLSWVLVSFWHFTLQIVQLGIMWPTSHECVRAKPTIRS